MSDKVQRQFVDTNILVYAYDRTVGHKRDHARALIAELWESGNGCISIAFWDAMIIQSATKLGCAILWSKDLNSGQVYEGVRVLDPFVAAS